jgi:predicted O-methyltransferase YrrM
LRIFSSEDPKETFDFLINNFFRTLASMQIREEFLALLAVFKEAKPRVVMEIGTANGGTLFCFSKLAPADATLISIDLPNGEFGGGYPSWKEPVYRQFSKPNQELFLLREDSHTEQTLQKVKKILNGRKIDFLFIDGDHTYEGVKRDFELYSSLVNEHGVISFHDVAPNGIEENAGNVKKFWKELKDKREFACKEFINDIRQGGCGIGVLFL